MMSRQRGPASRLRRLAPELPLPPYTYVPGRAPHPTSDPAGHSFGQTDDQPVAIDPARPLQCRAYCYGIDLFNHGYYWEAHETWEAIWHGCGRRGTTAGFLKGLIKLAAAGVKAREGRPAGTRRHGRRAAELFRQTASQHGPRATHYLGLPLAELIGWSDAIAGGACDGFDASRDGVCIVFAFVLVPAT